MKNKKIITEWTWNDYIVFLNILAEIRIKSTKERNKSQDVGKFSSHIH